LDRLFDNCGLDQLTVRGDDRGSLVAIEGLQDVPFQIARIYYIFGTGPGVERGFHAHKALHQFAVCVSGSCTIVLDNGQERRSVRLDRPDRGLHIGPMIWREMLDFKPSTVLLVLASAKYDEADYIRDLDEFHARVRQEHL